ncbi:MAG: hypothetical protein ACRDZM_06195 [Acidimicrobiia bacterium]
MDNNKTCTVSSVFHWRDDNMIFGYLDPGSGSLILQALIGGLAGIGIAIKAFRAKHGMGRKKADAEQEDPLQDPTLSAES